MNPATPGPLTILLLSDDPALLADEAGGRVPTITRCGCGQWGHGGCAFFAPLPVALLLVLDGALVRLGIFRAWDMADDTDDLDAALTMSPTELAEWIGELRRDDKPIGRVVPLRDGREVQS